jgi:hypothetical protein
MGAQLRACLSTTLDSSEDVGYVELQVPTPHALLCHACSPLGRPSVILFYPCASVLFLIRICRRHSRGRTRRCSLSRLRAWSTRVLPTLSPCLSSLSLPSHPLPPTHPLPPLRPQTPNSRCSSQQRRLLLQRQRRAQAIQTHFQNHFPAVFFSWMMQQGPEQRRADEAEGSQLDECREFGQRRDRIV